MTGGSQLAQPILGGGGWLAWLAWCCGACWYHVVDHVITYVCGRYWRQMVLAYFVLLHVVVYFAIFGRVHLSNEGMEAAVMATAASGGGASTGG